MEIPKSKDKKSEYLHEGVHLVKITNIEEATDREGVPIVDKNDNPGLTITEKDREGKIFRDLIFYGDERIDWMLDALLKAVGIDRTKGPISTKDVIGRKVFIAIKKVIYVNSEGDMLFNDNGAPRVYYNRMRYYQVVDEDQYPVISKDKLIQEIVDEKSEGSPPLEEGVQEKEWERTEDTFEDEKPEPEEERNVQEKTEKEDDNPNRPERSQPQSKELKDKEEREPGAPPSPDEDPEW